jgi:hypothetical protein
MTLKQWLAMERQPDHCGINARQYLKGMVAPKGQAIDRKIALRVLDRAIRRLGEALEEARAA